jgi:hypothetical protein
MASRVGNVNKCIGLTPFFLKKKSFKNKIVKIKIKEIQKGKKKRKKAGGVVCSSLAVKLLQSPSPTLVFLQLLFHSFVH